MSKVNPRQSNGRARLRAAKMYAAADAPCAICNGVRGPIHYDEPRNHLFPLSLAIDEVAPVARWEEFGYSSARECASDPENWQPTHWICNAQAGDKRKTARRADTGRRDAGSGAF